MLQERPFQAKITVVFSEHERGGLRAQCDDIPGFYLASPDKKAVLEDVVPTLEQLLKSNYDLDVEVRQLAPAKYVLRERTDDFKAPESEAREYTYVPRGNAA